MMILKFFIQRELPKRILGMGDIVSLVKKPQRLR